MLLVSPLSVFAQQATVSGIKPREFQGVEEIENKGYYTVYEAEDQSGKIRNYTLKFYDFSYKEIGSELIELSKVATVSGSANNATHLAIAFSDMKLKQVKVKSFDLDGKLTGELDLSESAMPMADVYKAPGGFVIVNQIRKSAMSMKAQFEIIGVSNELTVQWKKELNEETIREVIDVVASEEGVAVVYTSGKGLDKENYDQHLLRLSHEGSVIFDEVFASNYYYFPNKIIVDVDKTIVFGSYPAPGKSKPVGVFAIAFDASGNISLKKEIDYEKNISPEIKDIMSEEEINMKEEPQFIVNDVIKTPTGYVMINETIRLRPSMGLAVEISTGGSGGSVQMNTAFIMGDFVVLNLDDKLDLETVQVITKRTNKVVFEGTIGNVNQYHHILKKNNVSNYQFHIKNAEAKPSVVYTIRQSYLSNIQIGVADLNKTDKVIKSELIDSDLTKIKEVNGFGVMRNTGEKISVYLFKKGVLSFYDLTY